mgnify:CR=1 FL=1
MGWRVRKGAMEATLCCIWGLLWALMLVQWLLRKLSKKKSCFHSKAVQIAEKQGSWKRGYLPHWTLKHGQALDSTPSTRNCALVCPSKYCDKSRLVQSFKCVENKFCLRSSYVSFGCFRYRLIRSWRPLSSRRKSLSSTRLLNKTLFKICLPMTICLKTLMKSLFVCNLFTTK